MVWRSLEGRRQFLLLHRLAPGGPGFEGDWAWTPPSGARQPGETPDEAARRELAEETGLVLPLLALPDDSATDAVALYLAEAAPDAVVVLDHEHDEFAWLTLEEALPRCLPASVAAGLANAAATIDRVRRRSAGS